MSPFGARRSAWSVCTFCTSASSGLGRLFLVLRRPCIGLACMLAQSSFRPPLLRALIGGCPTCYVQTCGSGGSREGDPFPDQVGGSLGAWGLGWALACAHQLGSVGSRHNLFVDGACGLLVAVCVVCAPAVVLPGVVSRRSLSGGGRVFSARGLVRTLHSEY